MPKFNLLLQLIRTAVSFENLACRQQKSHVDPVRASAQHPDRTASHGNEAVRDKGTPHEPSAKLSKVSSLESDSTGAESYSQDSSSLDATSDEAPHGVLADNMSLNNQRLEYMLSSHTRDDDDPFLSAWCALAFLPLCSRCRPNTMV